MNPEVMLNMCQKRLVDCPGRVAMLTNPVVVAPDGTVNWKAGVYGVNFRPNSTEIVSVIHRSTGEQGNVSEDLGASTQPGL
jgi:hypothetical protein